MKLIKKNIKKLYLTQTDKFLLALQFRMKDFFIRHSKKKDKRCLSVFKTHKVFYKSNPIPNNKENKKVLKASFFNSGPNNLADLL